jgi:hypothetical protein
MSMWPRLKRVLLIGAPIVWTIGVVAALFAGGWWRLPGVVATMLGLAAFGFALMYRPSFHGDS